MLLITGDPKSWKDAIGRLMEYLYANGKFNERCEALERCLWHDGKKYRLKRHPAYSAPSSRDHWSYFIQYYKNTRTKEEFAEFIRQVPRMRGLTLWMKTMAGNKRAEWWFYTIYNTGAYIHNFMDWSISGLGNFGPERDNHWWITDGNGSKYQQSKTLWQRLWAWIWGKACPFYPVQNRAWQLKFLPESPRKEKQKRTYLKRTDKGNPIVRLLFGDKTVTQDEVDNYPEMANDRSGVKLNLSCRRWIYEIEEGYKRKLLQRLAAELLP